jgi:hypothetical protein
LLALVVPTPTRLSRVGQFKEDNWVVMTGDEVVIESTSIHKATRAMAKHPKRCLLLQVGHEDEPMNMFIVQATKPRANRPARYINVILFNGEDDNIAETLVTRV